MKIYPTTRKLVLAAVAIALMAGCKKEKKDNSTPSYTVSGTMTGTWHMVKKAYDENYSHAIDSDEVEIPDPAFSAVITFNADSTGNTVRTFPGHSSGSATFMWVRLSTSEMSSEQLSGTESYVPKYGHILQLSDTDMVLIDTQRTGTQEELNWTFYKR